MRLSLLPPLLISLSLCGAMPLAAQDDSAPQQPRISVSGEGSAFAAPDMAMITLGVTAQASEAAEAMDQTSVVTQAILERLSEFSIASRDVQTSDLSLNPLWNNRRSSDEPPKITGYEASNRVTVRVRDLSRLSDVLGGVLSDGANRLDELSFGLQYPEPLLVEARKAAIADAMARAKTYAEAAGLTLGPVLKISEGGTSFPLPEMAMAMRDASPVPVAQGETGITANVNMVFVLQN